MFVVHYRHLRDASAHIVIITGLIDPANLIKLNNNNNDNNNNKKIMAAFVSSSEYHIIS